MSSSDAFVMETSFDSLQVGRSSQFVVGRLLRFWDSKNIKKQGEFMGVTLLLLDEKDSVVHCFIPAGRVPYYRSSLRAGSVVKVSIFEVAKCPTKYKITEHPFLIRFIPQTTIVEVIDNVPIIKLDKFMIRKFPQLHDLANTNFELPDVVGQIQSVQGSDLKDPAVQTRVVVRLVVEPSIIVYLSLWDEVAAKFRSLLSSGERTETVMIVTTVNPKIFGGNLYLNSTPGTKFYFDTDIQAISDFSSSLGGNVREGFTCIDTKEGIKKKEVMSIRDLNSFISNSDEQTDFICKGRVLEVLAQNGRSFVSCTGCNKKLEQSGTSLLCSRCVNPGVTGVVKYRVELLVDDGKDTATFVVFDREMLKLTKKDAAQLTTEEEDVGGGEGLPQCLKELCGKEFVFQIRVTPFNFTPNHRAFTVSAILDQIHPETFNTVEDALVKGGEGDPSASGSMKVGDEVKELSRKRPRE